MGTCLQCANETEKTATVVVGTPVTMDAKNPRMEYEPYTVHLCEDCVKQYHSGFSGFLFYAALQLGWFSVAQYGLLSPFGLLGAALACLGLVSLFVRFMRWLSAKRSFSLPAFMRAAQPNPEEEASAALRAYLKKKARFAGKSVYSLQEYKRLFGADAPLKTQREG